MCFITKKITKWLFFYHGGSMNKQGFTLIELLATIIIIAIVMGIVFPSAVRVSRENKCRIYHEYEKMMEEYALVSPLKGEPRIELEDLDELDKVKRDCPNSYVLRKSINPLSYEAHLNCGDNYPSDDCPS